MSRKKRMGGTAASGPPAALTYIAGLVRAKAGIEAAYGHEEGRRQSMTFSVEKDGDLTVITFWAEKVGSRWVFGGISGSKNGEGMDLKDDMDRVLSLLSGGGTPGTPGASSIGSASDAKRDRGVEVRTTTVIRT